MIKPKPSNNLRVKSPESRLACGYLVPGWTIARAAVTLLMLELPEPAEHPALMAARFSAKVSRLMHGRKVDVLIAAPNLMRLPIHDMAFKEGTAL